MSEPNIPEKVSEDDLYAAALAEVQLGTTRPGLWAKAFADSDGDENKSKALYIKFRVQQEIERIQQEQQAAAALAAEPERRKEAELSSVLDQLRLKGFKIRRIDSGAWAVREPLGGQVKLDSDTSLLEYAQGHTAVAVSPELLAGLRKRESFSSRPSERTDEKSGPDEGAVTVLTNSEQILYFFLAGITFAVLFMLASRGLAGIAVQNLATAGFALGIGWSLNNKTRRLALSRLSYITLCVVYLIVANTLAVFMPFTSSANDEKRAYYLLLLTVIAYGFTRAAIKINARRPNGRSESRTESTYQSSVDVDSAKEPPKKDNQPFRAMILAFGLLCVAVAGIMTLSPPIHNNAPEPTSKTSTFDEEQKAVAILSGRYPDWREIVGPKGSQTEYRKWLAKDPAYSTKILSSNDPLEIANSIDKFKAETK